MHRTQIYLDDFVFDYLKKQKNKTHLSFSEIIRNNIKTNIANSTNSIIEKMEKASGSWSKNKVSPETYIKNMRKDRKI